MLNLHPGDLAFPWVRELIQKHHQSVLMKVNLPLIELEVAKEDLERFLQGRLHELSSDPKAQEVVEEISQILWSYGCRVQETILVPGIEQPGVFNRVVLVLAVDQPVEAVLLPGILDGLSGRLSLMPPGVVDLPTSAGRPAVPKEPASPKMEEGLWGHGRAPAWPDVPGPSHIGKPMETEGDKLLEQRGIDLNATIPAFTSDHAAAVIISDDKMTSFPGGWPEAVSTPKIEVAWGHKQPSEDRSPCASPQKKQATEEKEESPPPREAALPRGMSEKDILPKRYEVFTSDYDWVQSVRGSLLGLEAGTSPSRRDIDNSSCFVPQMAVSEQTFLR